MANVRAPILLPIAAAPLLLAAAPADGVLQVELSGVRNAKGSLLLCLTANARYFPDCGADPAARKLVVPAGHKGAVSFGGVGAGEYALAVMHDENGNAKLDTTMRIPREGFGFSRNPVVRFGAPKFRDVRFAKPAGAMTLPVTMRYFL